MAEDDSSIILLVVVALIAVIGLGLGLASFVTNESMTGMMNGGYGGGMMNRTSGTGSTPGGLEWGVLLVSAVFLALAVVLLVRARGVRGRASGAGPAPSSPPAPVVPAAPAAPAPQTEPATPAAAIPSAPIPEPTLVKLLDEDERRMYLELRDHGGQMYQRDIVALGMFSKPKVTRVLDKLETKGLIVREAHGMTNLVRLVTGAAK